MRSQTQFKNKIRFLQDPFSQLPLRRGLVLIPLALLCFALSPAAQAALPPPAPDGGYPGFNTAEGEDALFSLTTGNGNTAIGQQALALNTTGSVNTAIGRNALRNNTTGISNTAAGGIALFGNNGGSNNTAAGYSALFFNNASNNTAVGYFALSTNVSGEGNTAVGVNALQKNTSSNNTAIGFEALFANTSGTLNTASGGGALNSNTFGSSNTATGANALFVNNASFNTATGTAALQNNRQGAGNTATGGGALFGNVGGSDNTAVGLNALFNSTGGNNIALGASAGVNLTASGNNIDIGNRGVAAESRKIRIGTAGTHTATFIAGIRGVTVAGGVGVIVGSNGQLGTVVSSARFKEAIKPMDKASEAILALKPVTFHYKQELDPDGIPQFGLIAEQVEKVNPDLVIRDEDGKVNTVRYDAVNAMLLNEFLKEHRQVEELNAIVMKQEATNAQQQQEIKALTTTLKEQASAIRRVSDEVKLSKPSSRVATNDQ